MEFTTKRGHLWQFCPENVIRRCGSADQSNKRPVRRDRGAYVRNGGETASGGNWPGSDPEKRGTGDSKPQHCCLHLNNDGHLPRAAASERRSLFVTVGFHFSSVAAKGTDQARNVYVSGRSAQQSRLPRPANLGRLALPRSGGYGLCEECSRTKPGTGRAFFNLSSVRQTSLFAIRCHQRVSRSADEVILCIDRSAPLNSSSASRRRPTVIFNKP